MPNLYDLAYSPVDYRFDLTGAPIVLGGTSPFLASTGNPKDEAGELLPAYVSQVFFITVQGARDINQILIGTLSVVFKTSEGVEIGTLTASFDYHGFPFSETFTYTASTTTGAVIAVQPMSNGHLTDNGAVASYIGYGDFLSGNPYLMTPAYRCNLPYGATATGTLNLTSANTTSLMQLTLASVPNSSPLLESSGVLSTTKVSNDTAFPNRWDSPYGRMNGPFYEATAWDAYWIDGGEWRHLTSPPGGDTATFNLSWDDDEGEQTAYVRVTSGDGLIGWSSVSRFLENGKETLGCVQTPDGAFIMARAEGNPKAVVIRRMEANQSEGSVISTLAGMSRPRLTLHKDGQIVLLARNDANKAFERKASSNGGETWITNSI